MSKVMAIVFHAHGAPAEVAHAEEIEVAEPLASEARVRLPAREQVDDDVCAELVCSHERLRLDVAEVNAAPVPHRLVDRHEAALFVPRKIHLAFFIEAELPRLEALNEPDDADGEVEELNGFFRRYALAA